MSVARINFIEEARWNLTYRRMLLIGTGTIGLLVFLFLVQNIRQYYWHRQVGRLGQELLLLKTQKNEVREGRAGGTTQVGGGASAYDRLSLLFEKRVVWSSLLQNLSATTPPRLWLTGIISRDKEEGSTVKILTLKGKAHRTETVSEFVSGLTRLKGITNVVLETSERESQEGEALFHFSVRCEISG